MGENLIQVNWDCHKQFMFGNLSTLRDEEIHTDVILSCDGKFYPAHKLVLTMCSAYFAKAFQYAGNSSPIFFICGVKSETLEYLLSFIYNGTVTIPSDEVDDMAKAGDFLQIQELSQIASLVSAKRKVSFNNDLPNLQNNFPKTKVEPMVQLDRGLIEQIIKKHPSPNLHQCDYESQNGKIRAVNVNNEPNDPFEWSHDGSNSDFEFEGWDPKSLHKPKAIIKSLLSVISKKEKGLKRKKICFKCKIELASQKDLTAHFVQQHKKLLNKHYCKRCDKIFRFKKSLQRHKEIQTCGRKFCPKCTYSSVFIENFNTHLKSHRNENSYDQHEKSINGIHSMEITKDELLENFGNPYKKKRKFSNKALNEALKAISTDFENFPDASPYCNEYDQEDSSESEYNQPLVTQKKTFSCLCCDLTFNNWQLFNYHKQSDCKLLECPFCLKVFIKEKKDLLEDHKERHSCASKPYLCPFCTYTTDDQLTRDQHLDKHTAKINRLHT